MHYLVIQNHTMYASLLVVCSETIFLLPLFCVCFTNIQGFFFMTVLFICGTSKKDDSFKVLCLPVTFDKVFSCQVPTLRSLTLLDIYLCKALNF